ncbi:MAG: hypothetical protein M3Q07_18640 [Pseudobdellovibrionaceae bacterium]|nr:hypothetical protein [Pseudobdellovibrionaceae bacterium]
MKWNIDTQPQKSKASGRDGKTGKTGSPQNLNYPKASESHEVVEERGAHTPSGR